MKFNCNKSDLIDAISIVQKAIKTNSTVQILDGILIQADDNGVKLTGYDLETGIEADLVSDIVEKGSVVVNSKFFGENTIPIARFLDEDGKNARNNSGLIGEGKLDGTESYSTDNEGFVILFYNVDDTEFMGDQQLNFETAYEKLQKDNKSIGKNTKFFSINVSWNVDWKDGDTNDFKALSNYNNKYLSLEEQKKIFSDAILPIYTTQVNGSGKYGNNSNYVSDTVKLSNLQNSDFTLEYAGGAATDVYHTIPTCFLTYTKNKNTNKYDISKPDKVRFKQSLDLSSVDNATKEILDLFNFKINTSTRIQ